MSPVPDWPGALGVEAVGADVVVGRLDAIAVPLPEPSARDLIDAGRRSGTRLRLFLRRRAALRLLIGRRLGLAPETIALGYDKRGAPVLRAPAGRLRVSVSARDEIAAFALAPSPVGIDLEPVADPGPIGSALTPAERAVLATTPDPTVTVLQYWTAKEAYLKALGMGLMRDPGTIAVTRGADGAFGVHDGGRDASGRGAWLRPAASGGSMVVAIWATQSSQGCEAE